MLKPLPEDIQRIVEESEAHGAEIHILKDASHTHHLEKPEEFNTIVSWFMKRNE